MIRCAEGTHYADHDGIDEREFALDETNDVIGALAQAPPPKQLVEGDRIEAYLVESDAEMKLLAAFAVKGDGLEGAFGQGVIA